MKNRLLSLVYKLGITAACGWGLCRLLGLPAGFNAPLLKYFTIQSNLWCVVYYLAAGLHGAAGLIKSGLRGGGTFLPRVKGAVVVSLLFTMLVYQLLLAGVPFAFGAAGGSLANRAAHLFVPLLALLDWALFDEKGRIRPVDPLLWLLPPLAYLAAVVAASRLGVKFYNGSSYPYSFINFDTLGFWGALASVGLLAAAFLALGYLAFGLDRALAAQLGKGRFDETKNSDSTFDFSYPGRSFAHRLRRAAGPAPGGRRQAARGVHRLPPV